MKTAITLNQIEKKKLKPSLLPHIKAVGRLHSYLILPTTFCNLAFQFCMWILIPSEPLMTSMSNVKK